ncbi:MAG: diacylglycerol kinase family lipid kinase [Peptococcaceae bacterium]|nr:diacylglycerol kinase family lipid kinase [Peptococcaceae bacterium]
MRKVFFIVNPRSSGGSTRKRWEKLMPVLRREGILFDWRYTAGPYTAPDIAAGAVREGYDVIVAMGGDGTVYEVLNGMMDQDRALDERVSLAVFPSGTGCDFARTMEIPGSEEGFIKLLQEGKPVPIDVGRAEFMSHQGEKTVRYFLNVAEAGLGGETVARVNRTAKIFGGFVSFLWGAVVSITLFTEKYLKIFMDDCDYREGRYTLVACGNGRFFGGGMKICPDAEVDDGWLDVVALMGTSKWDLISNLPRVYRGEHLDHRRVWHRRAKKVTISSPDHNTLIDIDGEQPGKLDARFDILPKAINMLVKNG